MSTAERRFDVHVSVALAPWQKAQAESEMFVATIRWDYRARFVNPVLRFSCVSDPGEYRELLRDPTSAGVWYFKPAAGLNAGSSDAFELVQFTVGGQSQTVRHTKRVNGQLFTVSLDAKAKQTEPVQVSCTYRVLVRKHGHLLYLDFDKPCKASRWICGMAILGSRMSACSTSSPARRRQECSTARRRYRHQVSVSGMTDGCSHGPGWRLFGCWRRSCR